jgi:hypothetical protein
VADDAPFDGGCTCGEVRYRLLGRPMIVHACHCRWCQRETGSACEPLAGDKLGHCWKYRVGAWRIVCDIQDARIVVPALRLGDRRDVYR